MRFWYLLDALHDGVLSGQGEPLDVFDDLLFGWALNGAAQDEEEEPLHPGQSRLRVRLLPEGHWIRKSDQNELPENVL